MIKKELESCCGVSIISYLSNGQDEQGQMCYFNNAASKEEFRKCLRAKMAEPYRGGLQIMVTTTNQDVYAAEMLIEEGWIPIAERFYNPLHTSLLTMWGHFKYPEKKGKLHVSEKHLKMVEEAKAKIGNRQHKTTKPLGDFSGKERFSYWTSNVDAQEAEGLEGVA